jgi:hypothetical protein
MGLREEAIREHLELQRRRGGDLRQIALAEREALEPLVPGQTPDWAQGPALFDHEEAVQARPVPSGRPPVEQPAQQVAEASVLEQETAELDMSAVLGIAGEPGEARLGRLADQPHVPEFGPVRAQRIVPDPTAPVSGTEDFDWEIPGVAPSPGTGA